MQDGMIAHVWHRQKEQLTPDYQLFTASPVFHVEAGPRTNDIRRFCDRWLTAGKEGKLCDEPRSHLDFFMRQCTI
jgi:hypothetical protein